MLGLGVRVRNYAEPLIIKRRAVTDVQVRSIGYDRRRGRLEIEFTWKNDVAVPSGFGGRLSVVVGGDANVLVLGSIPQTGWDSI